MTTTLTIKDLSDRRDLDVQALSAVRGGQDNQANGTSQANGQSMASLANVGNLSHFAGGPALIQSDNTFTQSASNCSYSANADLASLGCLFPVTLR